MPSYAGGKAKLGKQIAEFIQHYEEIALRKSPSELVAEGRVFAEPFCGLLGVGIHFAREGCPVVAADANKDVVLLLQSIKDGRKPSAGPCSQAEYDRLKKSRVHSARRGFIGIGCSYGGMFFNSFRGAYGGDYLGELRSGLLKMAPYMQNVYLQPAGSYEDFLGGSPRNMTIYCDPPYQGNKVQSEHYFNWTPQDHERFWETMRRWSRVGNNLVFVSEYTAPSDFKPVWQKAVSSRMNNKTATPHVEKLFVYAPALRAPPRARSARSAPRARKSPRARSPRGRKSPRARSPRR